MPEHAITVALGIVILVIAASVGALLHGVSICKVKHTDKNKNVTAWNMPLIDKPNL